MPRKCGICGEEGHDRRNCPNNPEKLKDDLQYYQTKLRQERRKAEFYWGELTKYKNLCSRLSTDEKLVANEKKHKVVVKQFEVLFNIIDDNASNIPDQNYMDSMKALEALYDITKP